MKSHLRIAQFELELSGGTGRVITAEATGDENVRKALQMVGSAIAGEPMDLLDAACAVRPRARACDPQTSHDAAARAVGLKEAHERLIFAYLCARPGGGTKDEIAAGTGLDATAVARRMKGLCETAGVYGSGDTRKTPTGRAATVWKVRT